MSGAVCERYCVVHCVECVHGIMDGWTNGWSDRKLTVQLQHSGSALALTDRFITFPLTQLVSVIAYIASHASVINLPPFPSEKMIKI
jgi:hypothetical protein